MSHGGKQRQQYCTFSYSSSSYLYVCTSVCVCVCVLCVGAYVYVLCVYVFYIYMDLMQINARHACVISPVFYMIQSINVVAHYL
jgi:hypothetical protein